MTHWKIYHNPRCSKSREAMGLLEEAGIKAEVVEYLKHPPEESELLHLLEQIPASALVRTKEEAFRENPFSLDDPKVVARELGRRPELLERPIIIKNGEAVLGRPPESIKKLF